MPGRLWRATSRRLMTRARRLTAGGLAVRAVLAVDRYRWRWGWGDRRNHRRHPLVRAGPGRPFRPQPQRLEDCRHFRPVQRLLLEQCTDQVIEDVAVLGEDVERLLVGGR